MKIRKMLWLLFCATSLFFLTSCSGTTIKGKVVDYKDQPVAGAKVKFGGTGTETTAETQSDGTFTVSAVHRTTQKLTLAISKPNVGAYSEEFWGLTAPAEGKTYKLEAIIQTIPATRK